MLLHSQQYKTSIKSYAYSKCVCVYVHANSGSFRWISCIGSKCCQKKEIDENLSGILYCTKILIHIEITWHYKHIYTASVEKWKQDMRYMKCIGIVKSEIDKDRERERWIEEISIMFCIHTNHPNKSTQLEWVNEFVYIVDGNVKLILPSQFMWSIEKEWKERTNQRTNWTHSQKKTYTVTKYNNKRNVTKPN